MSAERFSGLVVEDDSLSGTVETPIGRLTIRTDDRGIASIGFPGRRGKSEEERRARRKPAPIGRGAAQAHLRECVRQLREYFAGKRRSFDLPLSLEGTEFERKVWRQLVSIPYGETRTYGEIARALGKGPESARAVGGANGRNPVAIVVPCHRVVGSGGSLTGFGGGLDRKRWLLEHESGQKRLLPP